MVIVKNITCFKTISDLHLFISVYIFDSEDLVIKKAGIPMIRAILSDLEHTMKLHNFKFMVTSN